MLKLTSEKKKKNCVLSAFLASCSTAYLAGLFLVLTKGTQD